jgi:hypothetical protein
MKREIKFRGKRVDNGEWVYGNYCTRILGGFKPIEHCIQVITKNNDGTIHSLSSYEVNPETVGQFTGLTDKNGADVYTDEKFRFKYLKELNEQIDLIGSFSWSDEDLRFEIDVHDHYDYVCLSYVSNGVMSNFELIDK